MTMGIKVKNNIVDLSNVIIESPELKTLLTTIFSPFITAATKCNRTVCSASIERFNRAFKIDSDLLGIMDEFKKRGVKFILAGGKMIHYVQNKKMSESENDYDIFIQSQDDLHKAIKVLRDPKIWGERPVLITKSNLYEYHFKERNLKIQLMTLGYAGPEDVISQFDIRACSIATDGEKIYWIKKTIKDIKDKKIFFMNLKSNKTIFMRIYKYQSYGFELSLTDMGLAAIAFLMPMMQAEGALAEHYLDRNFDLSKLNNYEDDRPAGDLMMDIQHMPLAAPAWRLATEGPEVALDLTLDNVPPGHEAVGDGFFDLL